jgi:two-component system chemotaxis sensor kinase CheA
MNIDLSQFHQVFFEESFEGLDIMEQSLLALTLDNPDDEMINSIFRAAHSIKGSSATFKFDQIAEFTHHLETLLDEMRQGERAVTTEAVDLLLNSVDCLRDMLNTLQSGGAIDSASYREVEQKLIKMVSEGQTPSQSTAGSLDSNTTETQPSLQDADPNQQDGDRIWCIQFKPQPQILRTGNEPLRMFRELAFFGTLESFAHIESVPDIDKLEEDCCYLSWTLLLHADIDKNLIEEVFEWVMDECELEIVPISLSEAEKMKASLIPNLEIDVASLPKIDESKLSHDVASSLEEKEEQKAAGKSQPKSSFDNDNEIAFINNLIKSDEKPNLKAQPEARNSSLPASAGSIRVGIEKIDKLINLVGELVITQSMLGQMGDDFNIGKLERLKEGLSQLEQNTRELQESVMQIRMLPISFVFNRFPRMVRDLSSKLGKKIELEIRGEATELDKTVMEQIGDPLVHLVRNSIDHGIEMPDERLASGKPEVGHVELNAYHQGGSIIIEVKDDGAGINKDKVRKKAIERGIISEAADLTDEQIYQLIFEPGFSTAEVISDVSGRGVGMDVVKKNISVLGGSVDVASEPGKGSVFTIRLPLTLAILDGQLVRIGNQIYVIPLTSILESLQLGMRDIVSIGGKMEMFKLRDEHVPIARLYQVFDIKPEFYDYENTTIVVVEGAGSKVGFMVDELLAQQQVVIKSLESNFVAIEGISGATILGDGKVALILDVPGMINRRVRKQQKADAA